MHTVVLGWFGISAVWFLLLIWRLAKAMMPGGDGLAGPGSIRLWLGFASVFLASCTLTSVLSDADTNALGHALSAGFDRVLGRVGTSLAMSVLFVAGLPWFTGIGWKRVAAWLDASFGLKLSRDDDDTRSVADLPRHALHRDEERRVRRAGDVQPTTAHTVNSMAPRQNGRFVRPTLWKPDPQPRPRERGQAAPRPHVEPVAPAGWLRPSPSTRAAGAPVAGTPAAGIANPAYAAAATKPARSMAGVQPTRPAPLDLESLRQQALSATPGRPAAALRQPIATHTAVTPRPNAGASARPQSRAAVTPPPAPPRRRPVAPARAPLYAWAEKPTAPIAPAPSVQETLRSIEASTAQWASMASATPAGIVRSAAPLAATAATAATAMERAAYSPLSATPADLTPTAQQQDTDTHRDSFENGTVASIVQPAADADVWHDIAPANASAHVADSPENENVIEWDKVVAPVVEPVDRKSVV